jgi:cyclophilin family peptidyl-prolyl cis-trans isomerase
LIVAKEGRLAYSQRPVPNQPMKTIAPSFAAIAIAFAGLAGSTPAQEQAVSDAKPVKIVMETSKGTIELELDAAKAPKTVQNFVSYVKKGHYDGLIFHRVIPDFMIQGGGFSPEMQQKETAPPIENEAKNGLKNVKGSIAMARTPNPHSASSQFFINLKDNSFLDYPGQDGWGYCVFGKVTKGQEVVDAIAKVATTSKEGHRDVPVEAITIKTAKVAE